MKHDKYKELLELNVLGELTKEEETELENHLFECEECSKEYARMKKLYSLITTEKPSNITDEDLVYARAKMFNTVNAQTRESSIIERINEFFKSLLSNRYTLAFSTIILIIFGVFVGRLVF